MLMICERYICVIVYDGADSYVVLCDNESERKDNEWNENKNKGKNEIECSYVMLCDNESERKDNE